MDFYIPGYYKGNKVTKYDIKSYMFKEEQYWFKSQYFDSFIEKIEKKGVIVTGNAQLLLVPYQDERLFFEKSIGVDLEKNVAEGNIVSLKLFFEELFTIAKKTTEFRTFVEQIENERKNDVDIFLKFLESKIAETLWSLFTSLILK